MVPVAEISQVGEARRRTLRLAEEIGLGEAECGRATIIASELATNLARYATGGELLITAIADGAEQQIDFASVDRGPGMADVERCMEDGYSSGGTAGNGLGAVKRLATEFDVYSGQPSGTIVFARLGTTAPQARDSKSFAWSVVSRPAPRETQCGDSWRLCQRGDELSLMIVDGLGHGPLAAEAAATAADVFDGDPFMTLSELLQSANRRMHGTRGGAMAAARVDAHRAELKYAGVGNIAGRLRSVDGEQESRGLVSHNGIVGGEMRKVQEFSYTCPAQGLLVMHSDGLQSRWTLAAYPGLARRHPGLVAGMLYRDFVRGNDDVTVAVVRLNFSSGAR
ncbi:MAG TPA: ATP-binding SpoIIE family protein phosphatase [Pirellulales bacterium]|nr:ATP-binding SpoIIE family protein phosphatase [Pirellulales bacterium]